MGEKNNKESQLEIEISKREKERFHAHSQRESLVGGHLNLDSTVVDYVARQRPRGKREPLCS